MKDLVTIIPVSNIDNSKTRLSPFLTSTERKNLLKNMLNDIITAIKSEVKEIYIVTKDKKVQEYSNKLEVKCIEEKEHKTNKLNNALLDAINEIKHKENILILPSDIPLIKTEHIKNIKQVNADIIIAPSKGGGTNLLCFKNNKKFIPQFGDMSYFKHIEEGLKHDMNIEIMESFYLSMDVNTPQDLGEIILHGKNTKTCQYLQNINVEVKSIHAQERLDVRKN